jgi:hypothetical protein
LIRTELATALAAMRVAVQVQPSQLQRFCMVEQLADLSKVKFPLQVVVFSFCELVENFRKRFFHVAGNPTTIDTTQRRVNQHRYYVPTELERSSATSSCPRPHRCVVRDGSSLSAGRCCRLAIATSGAKRG